MSNIPSNHLWELIHALGRAEKRYFKVYTERNQGKEKQNYMALFNAIAAQEVYDEEALKETFKEGAIMRNFALSKHRLHGAIMKSLAAYHLQHSHTAEVNHLLHQAEILYQKALYGQCEKILKAAEKLAAQHDNHSGMLQVIQRQKRLAERDHYEAFKGEEVEGIYRREMAVLGKLEMGAEMWHHKSKLFQKLFVKGQARTEIEAAEMAPEIGRIEKLLKEDPLDFEGRYLGLHTLSAYHFALGHYEASFTYLKENLAMMQAHLDLVKDEPDMMVGVLANLAYVSAKLNRFDDLEKYLELSRNLPKPLLKSVGADLEQRIFVHTHSLELSVCNLTGMVERGMEVALRLEREMPAYEHALSDVRRAAFYHGISCVYLMAEQPKVALKWNNALLNEIPIARSEDQYCFALMLHLLLHMELDNQEVIPHTLRSLERYLETRQRAFAFEQAFTKFVHEAAAHPRSSPAYREALEAFSKVTAGLHSDPYEKNVLEYFDFDAWVTSQLTGTPLAALLRERVNVKDVL